MATLNKSRQTLDQNSWFLESANKDDWSGYPATEILKHNGNPFCNEYGCMKCDKKEQLFAECPLGKPKRTVNIAVVKHKAYLVAIIIHL